MKDKKKRHRAEDAAAAEKQALDLRSLTQRLELQLQAIRRRVRQTQETEFASGDLTAPQKMVMSVVVRSGGISLKLLSQQVSLAHSTVSGIVDRLEKRGMLARHALPSDRRSSQIVASAKVQKSLKSQVPVLTVSPLIDALQKASASERRVVSEGIDILARLLE